MKTYKVVIKWNKKINDFECHYPNRNGRILGNNIFTMFDEFEKWKKEKLRDVIINAGYDPDSFRITIKLKP